VRHIQADLIILTVTACINLLKAICEERYSTLLEWTNAWMILASEELNAFVTLFLSFTKSVVGARHLLHGRKWLSH